jgi:glycosyltransferase involved in cell wall biosynthesis
MNQLISKFDLQNRVKVIGKIAGEKKDLLFSQSACVVVPSRFETFSIVALEALGNGCTLVSFDLKGLKWIPRQLRLVAKNIDVNLLQNEIQKAIDNPLLQIKLGNEGKKFAEKFSWDEISKQILNFLKEDL